MRAIRLLALRLARTLRATNFPGPASSDRFLALVLAAPPSARVPGRASAASDRFLALVLAATLCLTVATPAHGQTPAQAPAPGSLRLELGVAPERVTIGEPFRSVVQLTAPAGVRIEYGDIASGDSLEAVGSVELVRTSAGQTAAVYHLVAWAADSTLGALVQIRLVDTEGRATVREISLRMPEIVSVLAGAEELIEPRPPRGLVVPEGMLAALAWWWWLLLLLAAIIAGIIGYSTLRKVEETELPPPMDPRSWAIEQLEGAPMRTLLATGQLDELHRRVSWIVRGYAYRTHAELSPDLTSTELLARAGPAGLPYEAVERLAVILQAADRVKFARHIPGREESERLLAGARTWVGRYPVDEAADDPARRVA